jgi:hypothetical protein
MPFLLNMAHKMGWEVRMKELYRTPEQALANEKSGSGIANSLHCKSLAIDLVLFKNSIPVWTSEDYRDLGIYWESLHELCSWGGRFNDGGHFSVRDGGVR